MPIFTCHTVFSQSFLGRIFTPAVRSYFKLQKVQLLNVFEYKDLSGLSVFTKYEKRKGTSLFELPIIYIRALNGWQCAASSVLQQQITPESHIKLKPLLGNGGKNHRSIKYRSY